jgi:hypothetical protein
VVCARSRIIVEKMTVVDSCSTAMESNIALRQEVILHSEVIESSLKSPVRHVPSIRPTLYSHNLNLQYLMCTLWAASYCRIATSTLCSDPIVNSTLLEVMQFVMRDYSCRLWARHERDDIY